MRLSRYGIGFAVAVTLGIAAGVGYAAIPDSHGVIHACYDRIKGDLRVANPHNPKLGACVAGKENPLDWNQQGPPGPQGESGQVAHGIREFKTSGTLTVPAGVRSVFVQALGAGGGGGGSGANFCQGGGGGGAGGYIKAVAPVEPGRSFAVTIGAGGTGGAAGDTTLAGGPGGPGGDTSFGPADGAALVFARGGAGGGGGNADGPGPGGIGGGGDANGGVVISGGDGQTGQCLDSGFGAREGSVGPRPPAVGDGGDGARQNFDDGATSGSTGSPGRSGYMVVEW